jgi:Lrp/AsnC family transcriptional regulator, leucine-responsive regulatory protein
MRSLPNKQRKPRTLSFEPLDELDCLLLEALQKDARLRVTELSREVGLSAPAVADRLRKLEEREVVGYRAEVNPLALGCAISAIVRISPQSRNLHIIPQLAREIPEITECYRITGEDCYFMRVYLRSIDELEGILDRFTPHGRTTTSIVHSAPIPPRPLPIK